MKKENLLFGIIGLLAGIIIGFSVANYLNRNSPQPELKADTNSSVNPKLPSDHPPFGQISGRTQESPPPQILQAIEKARQNPNDFEAQMTAGDLYYQIQRFEDAAKFYQIAYSLNQNDLESIVKLGNSYFDAENYEEAENWYKKALQRIPNDTNVRTDYGLTFFLRNPRQIDRAIEEYKTTLGIDPNHELSLQNLAVAYKEKNDTVNFEKTLKILKTINPDNPAVRQFEAEPR